MAFLARLSLSTLALVSLATTAPLRAADGAVRMGFGGGDGVASWPTNTDSAHLEAIASTDDLLIGAGRYQVGGSGASHLMWQAVDVNGELRGDHHCDQLSNTL